MKVKIGISAFIFTGLTLHVMAKQGTEIIYA